MLRHAAARIAAWNRRDLDAALADFSDEAEFRRACRPDKEIGFPLHQPWLGALRDAAATRAGGRGRSSIGHCSSAAIAPMQMSAHQAAS